MDTPRQITVNNHTFREHDIISCFNMYSGKWARCTLRYDDSFEWYAHYDDGTRAKILTFEAVRVEYSPTLDFEDQPKALEEKDKDQLDLFN